MVGNSSLLNDGAAAVLLADDGAVRPVGRSRWPHHGTDHLSPSTRRSTASDPWLIAV